MTDFNYYYDLPFGLANNLFAIDFACAGVGGVGAGDPLLAGDDDLDLTLSSFCSADARAAAVGTIFLPVLVVLVKGLDILDNFPIFM